VQGSIVKRTTRTGEKRYFAVYRAAGKQRWKSFSRQKDAEKFLNDSVKAVHDGTYQHVQPLLVKDLLDNWIENSLEVRLAQGSLKPSTAKTYRSAVEKHLRRLPAHWRRLYFQD